MQKLIVFRIIHVLCTSDTHINLQIPLITVQEYPSSIVRESVVRVSPIAMERRSIPDGPLEFVQLCVGNGHVTCS